MFGELRSVLSEHVLTKDRWHAWLLDSSWTVGAHLNEDQIWSVRQMQARRDPDFELFSVPDEVFQAILRQEEMPDILKQEPERLMLCAHLELRPDVIHAAPWVDQKKPSLGRVIQDLELRDLRSISLSAEVLKYFKLPSTRWFSTKHIQNVQRMEYWGALERSNLGGDDRDSQVLEAMMMGLLADIHTLEHIEYVMIRQCGPVAERWHDKILENLNKISHLHAFSTVKKSYAYCMYASNQKQVDHTIEVRLSTRPYQDRVHYNDVQERQLVDVPEAPASVALRRVGDMMHIGRGRELMGEEEHLWVQSLSIGRWHGSVMRYRDRIYIVDRQSTSGTYINARLIRPHVWTPIQPTRDIVTMANLKLQFRLC